MLEVIKAPNKLNINGTCIFLAGSIEMGKAVDWQTELEIRFKDDEDFSDEDIIFFNPRRDDWDSSWVQSIDNPQFNEQVTWELTALEVADVIVLYFDPKTQSPISLLELGLHAKDGKLIVCCPEGFWRKGNVEIVCDRFNIPLFTDKKKWYEHIKTVVKSSSQYSNYL